MTATPRYLVAKYVSDLQRMEPRNIGVVLWCAGSLFAKFLAEKPDKPGDVDGRSIPSFVSSASAYKQWVSFWREELDSRQATIERIKEESRGNFWLVDGGAILDDVSPSNLPRLVDDLYRRLVLSGSQEESRDPMLDEIADDVIRKLRLHRNNHFHTRYEVACQIAPNVKERFEFSHAYRNGTLKRLYQRVPLARKRTPLRRTVHDSAWMFEKVVQQGILAREQVVALVYATDEHKSDPEINWSFDVLRSVARVSNLADPVEAVSAFIIDE